jgi:cyclohexanone monooxygenase
MTGEAAPREDKTVRKQALIIGAGIAGISQAVQLSKAGVDFLILEKATDVGGTWRDNTYPGARADSRSYLYSYSHDQNPSWSSAFAAQPEMLAYLQDVARRRGLLPRIRFGTEVTAACWDASAREWTLAMAAGPAYRCRFLILAVGRLHVPRRPSLPGADSFAGPCWHSSGWNHDIDLDGKHVALIGVGGSGVQVAPYLAERAGELTIFQRTSPWVLPKPERPVPEWQRRVFRWLPGAQALYRLRMYLKRERTVWRFYHQPDWLQAAEDRGQRRLRAGIEDPVLRGNLTPGYRLGCRQVVFSSDFYRVLSQPNVRLVGPAAALAPGVVVDGDGTRWKADAVIYATGFETTGSYDRIRIEGTGGQLLTDAWRGGVHSYNGIMVPGFPNMFILLGPHFDFTCMFVNLRAQSRFVVRAMRGARSAGGRALEVRPQAERRFQREVRQRYERTVWGAGDCRSWDKAAAGSVMMYWPGYTWTYRRLLRRLRRRDFLIS